MRNCIAFVTAGVWIMSSALAAQGLGDFAGRWRNVDPRTRGITTIEVRPTPTGAAVHLWGACSPDDCDMGERPAVAYADNVGAKLTESTKALVVELGSSRFVVLRLSPGRELKCESFSRFTDGSDRTNIVSVETLRASNLRPARD